MPDVSVLIPAFRAVSTLGTTLEHLAHQTHRDFEVIVLESGPARLGRPAVQEKLPGAKYRKFQEALLPHQALNRGLEVAEAELLAFTDADAYPAPDWLERLLAANSTHGEVVYGGVALHGSGWLVEGAHLCKFDKWLPAGEIRPVEEGPTVNMLVERNLIGEVGPFTEATIHADTDLSWRLRRAGYTLWFAPMAVVAHHHQYGLASFLAERYRRGRTFARFERIWSEPGGARTLVRASVSLLPLRLGSQLVRVGRNARRAGMTASFLRSLPVVAAGLYAWLVGEAHGLVAAN